MTERWLRWYDGTVRDGKFRIAADLSEVPVATVIGVWASLLEDAATSHPRGRATKGAEHHALFLDLAETVIGTVWNALERLGMIENAKTGIVIINWSRRQFETDAKDPTAKDRKEKWKQSHTTNGTLRNAAERFGTPETESESYTDKDILIKNDWPKDYRERFWQAYPRKVGKGAAIRKLEAIRRSREISFDRLLAAIKKIDASEEKYIPHPTTWLNQGRYLDNQATGPPAAYAPKPSDGLPTAEELRAKYANARGNAGKPAAEGAAVLDGGVRVCEPKPGGLDMD